MIETYRDLRLELVLKLCLLEANLPSKDDSRVKDKDVSLLLGLDGELCLRDLETALEIELSHCILVLLRRRRRRGRRGRGRGRGRRGEGEGGGGGGGGGRGRRRRRRRGKGERREHSDWVRERRKDKDRWKEGEERYRSQYMYIGRIISADLKVLEVAEVNGVVCLSQNPLHSPQSLLRAHTHTHAHTHRANSGSQYRASGLGVGSIIPHRGSFDSHRSAVSGWKYEAT